LSLIFVYFQKKIRGWFSKITHPNKRRQNTLPDDGEEKRRWVLWKTKSQSFRRLNPLKH
jgi:hypothetical protein